MLGKIRIVLGAIIAIPAIVLSIVLVVLPVLLTRALRLNKISNGILRWGSTILSQFIIICLGMRVNVSGLENLPKVDEAACYMANHLSILDVVLIQGKLKLRTGYIGKAELKKVPVLNLWFFANKSILLDRKSPKSSIKAILDGVKQLKDGWSIVVFPEGTRNKKNSVSEFKHGTMKLATRSKRPIVPICITNSQNVLGNHRKWRAKPITLTVLPRIETKNLTDEEIKELNVKLHDEILKEYEVKYALTKN